VTRNDNNYNNYNNNNKNNNDNKSNNKNNNNMTLKDATLYLIILTYVRENAFCFKIQTSSNGTDISTTTTTDISDEIVDVLLH